MNNPEKMHVPEAIAEVHPAAAGAETAPEASAAETMFNARAAMLGRVERHIPVRLREKLRAKIVLEKERLARFLAAVRRPAPVKARPITALNPAYFEPRPLQINIFE